MHIIDVSCKRSTNLLPQDVLREHGEVDILFNNAGVTVNDSFEDTSETDWDWVINTNLHGIINLKWVDITPLD